MTVRVVTDSSAVVPSSWAKEARLTIVPLQLSWPDGTSVDDMSYSEYIAQAGRRDALAQTAAPSPGAFQVACEELLAEADAVVVVCPAAELSATYNNASIAARAIGEERVCVLDGRTAAAGQGLVALEAARAAQNGASLDGVIDRALVVAARVEIWATLERLDQLRRSGRVPAIAAVGSGALGLMPVVRYAKGSPRVVGVTRSLARAAERIFRAWERSVAPTASLNLVILHSKRRAEAEGLAARIRERVASARAEIVEVSAGMAAHTGPGLLGLAWFWDN